MGIFDFFKKKELEEIRKLKALLEKYKPITDINKTVEDKTKELQELSKYQVEQINNFEKRLEKLSINYENSLKTYKKLRKEVGLYESKLDLIEFGVYEPIYDFEKSDRYREEQKRVIQRQKNMIKEGRAAICSTTWSIDGSEAKGRASTKRNIKLILRAFNGECNSLISKVKWNNVTQIITRIEKSFHAINKLGESATISIQHEYLDLKIKELKLEHEFQLKKQKEKEELRAIQEQIREEEKAKREFEKAQKIAEKEEKNYQIALEKARKEIAEVTGDKHDKLRAKIEKLEQELQEAQVKKERALSMAQQTKRGHVYIISNIGSFGENVYKIGMTRRLEPKDRVKELGDASVPFKFDIHAMIYSDEAPTLEKELHRAFDDKKVNMLNYRKEFFNVSLEEIEEQLNDIGIEAEFSRLPEAIEYRETLAILEKMKSQETKQSIEETIETEIENEFPSSIG